MTNNVTPDVKSAPCPRCGVNVPTKSRFCANCGATLLGEEPEALDVINNYVGFIRGVHKEQVAMLKWCIAAVGIFFPLIMGFIGVGAYKDLLVKVEQIGQNLVKTTVESELEPEKLKALVDSYSKELVGVTITDLERDLEQNKVSFNSDLMHEVAYLYIQMGRSAIELATNGDQSTRIAKRYFSKADRQLKKLVDNDPDHARSWFELGRLSHYYPEKFPDGFNPQEERAGLVQLETWKNALTYYTKAIANYSNEERGRFEAEPRFFVSQLRLRLHCANPDKIPIGMVEGDIERLITALDESALEDKHKKMFLKKAKAIKENLSEYHCGEMDNSAVEVEIENFKKNVKYFDF